MKSSWIGIGFSHHKVPSLSNTATRSSGGTAADSAFAARAGDKVDDRLFGWTVTPTRQILGHVIVLLIRKPHHHCGYA